MDNTVRWFAYYNYCLGRLGPFATQAEAAQAVMRTNGVPHSGAFVWPESAETTGAKTGILGNEG